MLYHYHFWYCFFIYSGTSWINLHRDVANCKDEALSALLNAEDMRWHDAIRWQRIPSCWLVMQRRSTPCSTALFIIHPLSAVLVTHRLSVCRDLIFLFILATARPATGSDWLGKCLSHLAETEQQMDSCSDCTKRGCLGFDEDTIYFTFYLS